MFDRHFTSGTQTNRGHALPEGGRPMFEFANSTTHRRGFLGRMAGALALGVTGVPAGVLSATGLPTSRAAGADPQLDAWLGKIKGQHRIVFDAPGANDGFPLVFPRVYLNTMNATYGTTDADSTAVVILRHHAAPFALTDDMWAKYKLGAALNVNDGSAPATRNIYATITGLPLTGVGALPLLQSGVLIGACNVALTVQAGQIAKAQGLDAAAVHADFVAHLFPGVQVLPSGVLGVGLAQEKGCGYCFAS
jgi:hypothetical protein